jgi:hypothetical protein
VPRYEGSRKSAPIEADSETNIMVCAGAWRNDMMTDLNDLNSSECVIASAHCFRDQRCWGDRGLRCDENRRSTLSWQLRVTADKSPTAHSAVSAHNAAECFRETQRSGGRPLHNPLGRMRATEERRPDHRQNICVREVISLLASDPYGTPPQLALQLVATIRELSLLGGFP